MQWRKLLEWFSHRGRFCSMSYFSKYFSNQINYSTKMFKCIKIIRNQANFVMPVLVFFSLIFNILIGTFFLPIIRFRKLTSLPHTKPSQKKTDYNSASKTRALGDWGFRKKTCFLYGCEVNPLSLYIFCENLKLN